MSWLKFGSTWSRRCIRSKKRPQLNSTSTCRSIQRRQMAFLSSFEPSSSRAKTSRNLAFSWRWTKFCTSLEKHRLCTTSTSWSQYCSTSWGSITKSWWRKAPSVWEIWPRREDRSPLRSLIRVSTMPSSGCQKIQILGQQTLKSTRLSSFCENSASSKAYSHLTSSLARSNPIALSFKRSSKSNLINAFTLLTKFFVNLFRDNREYVRTTAAEVIKECIRQISERQQ